MPFYINTQNQDSSREIARVLEKCIQRHKKDWSEIVFLCIGSDRVTGDCLGPYVGYRLSQYQIPGIFVYGTLNQPVHAVNLSHITDSIASAHPSALVIAIDASLGEKRHLGYVSIGNGSLRHKMVGIKPNLVSPSDPSDGGTTHPEIIAGILEYLTLQTTRLSTVITLADTITQGILGSFSA